MTPDHPSGDKPELPLDATLLRTFVRAEDRHGQQPLHEAIVMERASCISPVRPCSKAQWAWAKTTAFLQPPTEQ